MTPLDLNELRRLHAAALSGVADARVTKEVLDFARAAHAALPELLDELERLRAGDSEELYRVADERDEAVEQIERAHRMVDQLEGDVIALRTENERLRTITGMSMGIGDGTGSLFVYGDYESIKTAQQKVFELENLRAENERLRQDVRRLREERDRDEWWAREACVEVDLIDPSEVPKFCCADCEAVGLERWLKARGA